MTLMNLSDTQLLHEAQEVYKTTGRTPQQIAEINKELVDHIIRFVETFKDVYGTVSPAMSALYANAKKSKLS
jgi:hypothetical protein